MLANRKSAITSTRIANHGLRTIAIALMMEAESASQTPVNFYETTQRNIPEDRNLHTRRRENLKSHHLV
jgi:hypothetical protein